MTLNTWAVSILRYGTRILKWNKNELQEMDRKTRKFMTMITELHPRSDVARLYVSRRNGGSELIRCENSVNVLDLGKWPGVVLQKQYRAVISCCQNK